MSRFRRLMAVAIGAAALLAIAVTPSSATNAYPTTNDQSTTIRVARYVLSGVSAPDLSTDITNLNARITQLRVVNPNTPTFAATLVKNTGAYASGWWWYYGLSPAQVTTYLTNNNARLISLDPYVVGGQLRFAAVMVPNTGSQARSWWWYYGQTASSLQTNLTANNARLVSVRPYMSGATRLFAAVMVSDTGQDFTGWHYWLGQSIDTIIGGVGDNGERLISLAKDPSGGWDAIAVSSEGENWYWAINASLSTLGNNIGSHGTRLIDISPYGSGRFAEVELDDSNPSQAPINVESTRVHNYAETHQWYRGFHGEYFAPTNSAAPIVAENSAFRFEPASAIKALYLLYTLQNVSVANLSGPITYYYPTVNVNPGACPNPAWEIPADAHTTTIQNALNQMMQNSNNIMTRAFAIKWGPANVEEMARNLGMGSTSLRQAYVGCAFKGAVRNELTLQDIAKLYNAVETGAALTGTARTTFFNTMQGGHPSSTDAWGSVVTQEAASLGKSGVVSQFLQNMDVRWKGGSYQLCLSNTCNPYKDDYTLAGRMLIPFKVSGRIVQRSYVFGDFINDAVIPCLASSTSPCAIEQQFGNTLFNISGEEARSTIHAALMTW